MTSFLESTWSKSKLLIKGLIIAFLVLLLQIPTFYIRELISEREQRQRQAVAEVSAKWGNRQVVSGPVLVVPYRKAGNDSTHRTKSFAYFLPDELQVKARLDPLEKHRGIFKVMLYASSIHLEGSFSEPALDKLNLRPEDVLWNEAMVKLPLSDNKGLNEEFSLRWNDTLLRLSPQTSADEVLNNALQTNLRLKGPADLQQVRFSADLQLNGSEQFLVTPTGRATTVSLSSSWPHPSFNGNTLPQSSALSNKGFTATWKSVSFRRDFPQQWLDNAYAFSPVSVVPASDYAVRMETMTTAVASGNVNSAAFGVDLFVPVNGYQKTLRSIKYAALCVLLTFAAFFLLETNNQKSVHPFHYGLIGLALVLFYTLLLSFSEYIDFNLSYAVAAVFTIGLIGWFVRGLLASSRLSLLLTTILVLLYVYVFTILQLQDYSLLLGSLGLFLALGLIMRYSRKIQW